MQAKHPEIAVRLTEVNGNVFAVIGAVRSALQRAGLREEARSFVTEAMSLNSYDEVLQLCLRTVSVE